MATYGQALSEHPLASHATGEVVGAVLEAVGEAPDLAVVFATAAHAGEFADIAFTVRELLRPKVLLGCTAESVVGGPREVEGQPAVSLWAGNCGDVTPVRLRVQQSEAGASLIGWPDPLPDGASGLLLLADPFTFPTEAFLSFAAAEHAGLPVLGGMASAGHTPGANRLVIDGTTLESGAVGVLLGPGARLGSIVSQGCRPIGEPFVVTDSDANVIRAIAGQPPLHRLEAAAQDDPEAAALWSRGLHVGIAIDEHKEHLGRGDFLIRNIIGVDRANGSVATDQVVDVGTTVQFQVRDAAAADEELRHLLAGQRAEAALLFTCNGRGIRLFGDPDHDAATLSDALGGAPVAGMFCMGELGPVGGRPFLHGFTASVVLFGTPPAP